MTARFTFQFSGKKNTENNCLVVWENLFLLSKLKVLTVNNDGELKLLKIGEEL